MKANQTILLKGGTVLSMDPDVGNFTRGDVLIQGSKIAVVGPDLGAPSAEIIDCANAVVVPGFIDCHRHSWEGVLRRILPNGDFTRYMETTNQCLAKYYRPHDMYVGNLITALGCIDAGITCLIDNSHNSRSAAHSDAAIRALMDSGIRAVHASGPPQAGDWGRQWPEDLTRLQRQFFSSEDQLVTLRMFSALDRDNYAYAKALGLEITTELVGDMLSAMKELNSAKLLGPDVTFNHCNAIPAGAWQIIRDTGCKVNVCPRSDPQYGILEGICALQQALDHGIRPGLSVDNETSYGTDMFTEMRVAFFVQRALATNTRFKGDPNPPRLITVQEILECATVNGAHCAGLSKKCGSLTPGKEADLLIIRTDEVNLYPSNNAFGTVVAAADARNIDTVIIGGVVRKRHGEVMGLELGRLMEQIDESRNYLLSKAGYTLDVFQV